MSKGETELLLAEGRVVTVFEALGVDYLVGDTEWAAKIGVVDLLERALEQTDPK
jgi:hypothetical protein